MLSRRKKKDVAIERAKAIKELKVDVPDVILNNQASPIDICGKNGKSILVLEPYGSVTLSDSLKETLNNSEQYRNLIARGILAKVKYQ